MRPYLAYRLIPRLVIPLLVSASAALHAGPKPLVRFFPLDPGNRWTYVSEEGFPSDTLEVIVLGRDGILARVAYQHPSEPGMPPLVSFEKRLLENGAHIDIQLPDEPGLHPHYLFEEDSWTKRDVESCDDQRLATVVSRDETVMTPAGSFANCVRIAYGPSRCADAGVDEEWWAPSVGLVKRTFQTIAGPRAWVLSRFDKLTLYKRGDTNADAEMDIGDAVYLLSYLFTGGRVLDCEQAGDANNDDELDISDPLAILNHLFAGAPPPPPPFADCGVDGFAADLECESFGPCAQAPR